MDAERQLAERRAILAAADAYERKWITHLRATRPDWDIWWWRDVCPVHLIKSGLSVVYKILQRSHNIEYGLDGLAYDKTTNTYYFLQFKMRTGVTTMQPSVFGTFLGIMGVMNRLRTDEGAIPRHAGFDATSKARGFIGTNIPFSQDTQRINTALDIESHVLAPEEFVLVPPPAPAVATEYVLRDYQRDAIDALRAAKDHRVTSIVMPCGVGKTYTMLASMDAPTLVVVPFLDHCKQLRDKAHRVGVPRLEVSGVGTRVPTEVASFVAEGGPRCVVTTRTSFREVLAKLEGVRFAKVFFDEAHHILKEERDAALRLAPSLTLVTATPPHNAKTDACWRDAFPAYRMTWEEAIQRNFIVPPRLLFPLIRDRSADDDEGSYSWETRARWLLDASRAHSGITNAFVYVNNTAHVDAVVQALHAVHDPQRHRPLRRCRFVPLTHKTHSKTRAALYKEMEQNTRGDMLIVFVSVFVLDEGVDVNMCDAIFLAELPDDEGASFSIEPTRLVQRASRANRMTVRKQYATVMAWCPSASIAAEVAELVEVGMGTGTDILRVEALALDALDGEDERVVVDEVQHAEAVKKEAHERLERRRAKEASGVAATEHANLLRAWVDREIAWREANGKRWADEVRGAPKEEVRIVKKLRGRHGANNDDARRRLEAVDATFFDPYMVRATRLVIEHTLRRHRANGERGLVPWPIQSDKTRFDLRSSSRTGFEIGIWFHNRVMERRNGTLDPTVAAMLDAVDETWWMDPVTRTIASLEDQWDASRNAVPARDRSTPYGPADLGLVLDGQWINNRRAGVKKLLGLGGKTNKRITWGHLRRLLRVMPTFMDTDKSARTFGEAGFVPFLKERLGLTRDASAADLDAALAAEDEKADDTTGVDVGVGVKRKRQGE
jgi:superfamily II DNA or RNA helicase